MLDLGRAGTWNLSSLQPLSQRERQPCRMPCRTAGPHCLLPWEGQSLRGHLLDFVKRGVANLPASARLEPLGKVLGASRKWLFGYPRHCSTFLDADPHSSGTVPENRTWTAFSGASSDRSSKAAAVPGHSRQSPGLVRTLSGRQLRTRGGSDALAPTSAGGTFPEPLDGIFSASLANVRAP